VIWTIFELLSSFVVVAAGVWRARRDGGA